MPTALIQTLIGQTVNYYRCKVDPDTKENVFLEGRGVALSVFLNPDKRPMVQVKDGETVVNIDAAMINASEMAKDSYRAMVEMIDKLQNEFNAKQMELVKDYNTLIDAAYTAGIGPAIDITENKVEGNC